MKVINATPETGVFTNSTARISANHPQPKMLLGKLWHEGELAVMFGDSSIGKSLLAVQAAQAISSGKAAGGFITGVPAQKVLYFDFDHPDRKFSEFYRQCRFNSNFTRFTISKEFTEYHKFGKRMFECMAEMVEETGARVLIIDSLYTLKYFISSNFFIEKLLQLKNRFNLSVLLVAETKKPKFGKPLFLGNLAYNKTLTGLADSVFAMGASATDKDGRYIIQLKGKEAAGPYEDNKVITGCIRSAFADGDGGRAVTGTSPGFEFTGYGTEKQLLLSPPTGMDALILNMKKNAPYLSLGEIAQRLKTNKMKVKRVLERYEGVTPVTPVSAETLPSDPSRDDVGLPNHPGNSGVEKSSPCPLPLPIISPQGEMPKVKPANSRTQETSLSNPFRGDIGLSNYPSDPGVNQEDIAKDLEVLDALITSYCKNEPHKTPTPDHPQNKKTSYSQQLKQRLNKTALERRKKKV